MKSNEEFLEKIKDILSHEGMQQILNRAIETESFIRNLKWYEKIFIFNKVNNFIKEIDKKYDNKEWKRKVEELFDKNNDNLETTKLALAIVLGEQITERYLKADRFLLSLSTFEILPFFYKYGNYLQRSLKKYKF